MAVTDSEAELCTDGKEQKPVNEVVRLTLQPGESLEGYGYSPDDILDAVDATYSGPDGMKTQYCIRLWVLKERYVDTGGER